jgi:branched-chain amino acid transport system ATP-binding protein
MTGGYGGADILHDCTVSVDRGQISVIVGPNGAGKSTAMKAVFGMLQLRKGTVRIGGDDITALSPQERVGHGMAFVPQTQNVFTSMTVEENLEMGAFLRPKQFRERLEFVAELFPRLVERGSQRAGSLSGGERQMLAMSRALMMDPEVLLLDEPSAGLSPALQDQVFVRTREINKAGVSVVMVEQNARRCLQICHRGYVLDQGTNAYTGAGKDLLHDPKVIELYLGTLAQVK